MSETQQEIERHNERELWNDVANHLRIAGECIEQAQSSLEDLGLEDYAKQLDEQKRPLASATIEALEKAARV